MAKQEKKVRGVFEKVPGSSVWWIQYFDAQGRRRREKAGLKSSAITSTALAAFQLLFLRSRGEGPVFVNTHGIPLQGYKHWFEPAVRNCKISDVTWYCLRHTFASRLVMAGVDLPMVAELMGHKTIQMTMRYAHLAPAHNLEAVERLSPQPAVVFQDDPTPTTSATGQLEAGLPVAKAVQ